MGAKKQTVGLDQSRNNETLSFNDWDSASSEPFIDRRPSSIFDKYVTHGCEESK